MNSEKRRYLSKLVGLHVPLPEGYVDKDNFNSSLIKFRSDRGGFYETSDPFIQDFIEGNPEKGIEACKPFKQGIIKRVPTDEELKEQAIIDEQNKFIEMTRKGLESGLSLPTSETSDANVRSLAKSMGIPTSNENGEKLTKDVILGLIYEKFGKKYESPKRGKKDED